MKLLFIFILCLISSTIFSQTEDSTKLSTNDSVKTLMEKNKNNKEVDSSEYIIRKAIIFQSKNPTQEEIQKASAKLWLLKIYFMKGNVARPLTIIERNGRKFFVEYEPIKIFATEKEALDFAKVQSIRDIELK